MGAHAAADLKIRLHQAELMDAPDLDPQLHRQALAGLRRVNLLSLSAARLWREIRSLEPSRDETGISVLDVACGGGDVSLAIARTAASGRYGVRVEGCDISPLAIEVARQRAQQAGVTNASFFVLDALRERWPGEYDVVMCSLFLHHLSTDDAVKLLRLMAEHARRLVLVNDLRRTQLGYVMAWWGCRLLSRSRIVHADGPASVAAAFTRQEALDLAQQAGLKGAVVVPSWPQRFLLRWSPP